MAAPLEARNLCRSYGDLEVLRDVSLTVRKGDMLAITGRSGSGKSTLFKLLAGLDRPTRGEVLLDGVALDQLSDAQRAEIRLRRLGIVFQSLNLLPDLTALENVRLPLDIAGAPREAAQERAEKLLELVRLPEAAGKQPHMLSGGEAQRVAIARAIANDPLILLADEPTGSLDTGNAENVLRVFEDLNRSLGTTVVMITHDPVVMRRLPRRCVIDDGRLSWPAAVA